MPLKVYLWFNEKKRSQICEYVFLFVTLHRNNE